MNAIRPNLKLVEPQIIPNQTATFGDIGSNILAIIQGTFPSPSVDIHSIGDLQSIGLGPLFLGGIDTENWKIVQKVQEIMRVANDRGIPVLQTQPPIYTRGFVESNHLHVGGEATLTGNEAAVVIPKFLSLSHTGVTGKFSIEQILNATIS